MRDVALLSVAVVIGAVLSPQLALVGLPVAAAGLAGLAYRGHVGIAAFGVAIGVVAAAAVQPSDALFVAPALVAVLLAVTALPKRSSQVVGAGLVAVFALASAGHDEFMARAEGSSLTALVTKQMLSITSGLAKSLGASVKADVIARLDTLAHTMAIAWPSQYFETAVLLAVVVIAVIAWAARRAGQDVNVPPLSRVDLTPHVLWVFIAGLLLLAASYGPFSAAKGLGAVGLNLVLCARTLFFLQGISVSAGVLDRAGVGLGGRIFALAALAALDALTLVVSFLGLMDFWINFRRLPRDGMTPAAPAEPADPERRW